MPGRNQREQRLIVGDTTGDSSGDPGAAEHSLRRSNRGLGHTSTEFEDLLRQGHEFKPPNA